MPTVNVSQFRALWAELHNRAAHGAYFVPSDLPDADIESVWLDRFASRIRCAGCRRHWREVLQKIPPPFADLSDESRHSPAPAGRRRITRADYFCWTVRAHNAINRLLGKPIVTLRAARKLWRFDTF